MSALFSKLSLTYQGTHEERTCSDLLFNDTVVVRMGDRKLNNIAALTWNVQTCNRIFTVISNALNIDMTWQTLEKALYLLHTIVLYGSELSIDRAIDLAKQVHQLKTYNSAMVKRGFFGGGGGMDFGGGVRAAAQALDAILATDDAIRAARIEAGGTEGTLVPLGVDNTAIKTLRKEHNSNASGISSISFGQGIDTSVGAGFSMEQVPGMYHNRPDRYFDDKNDNRGRNAGTQDSQFTRDKQAPDLLDLAFDNVDDSGNQLPEAQYLPALQRQQELENQLRQQQEELQRLQQMAAMQQQQQQQQQQQHQQQQQQPWQYQPRQPQHNAPPQHQQSDSLLDLIDVMEQPAPVTYGNQQQYRDHAQSFRGDYHHHQSQQQQQQQLFHQPTQGLNNQYNQDNQYFPQQQQQQLQYPTMPSGPPPPLPSHPPPNFL